MKMTKDSCKREDKQGRWDRHWPHFNEGDFYLFAYFLKQMAFLDFSYPKAANLGSQKYVYVDKWE